MRHLHDGDSLCRSSHGYEDIAVVTLQSARESMQIQTGQTYQLFAAKRTSGLRIKLTHFCRPFIKLISIPPSHSTFSLLARFLSGCFSQSHKSPALELYSISLRLALLPISDTSISNVTTACIILA